MKFGKWINTTEKLPPKPEKYNSKSYLATVINNQVICVNYVKTKIRNKEVIRWEWQNKPCPWDIIAWMPFPEPYNEK